METTAQRTLKPTKTPVNLIKKQINKPAKSKAVYKYTEQFVSQELDSLLEILKDKEQIQSKAQLFTYKEYSPQKFSQWRLKYSASKRIDEKLKKIENIIEARLIQQGLTSKNFAFVIFLLKNNYGYQDKREVAQETTHTFKVQRGLELPKGRPRKVVDLTPQSHNE